MKSRIVASIMKKKYSPSEDDLFTAEMVAPTEDTQDEFSQPAPDDMEAQEKEKLARREFIKNSLKLGKLTEYGV